MAEPWLKVNPNFPKINAAAQDKAPNSPLNYFRKVVAFRKNNPVLVYGKYTLLDKSNPDVYAYTKVMDGKKLLIVLNFSKNNASTKLDLKLGKELLNNYPTSILSKTDKIELRPYEAKVFEVK